MIITTRITVEEEAFFKLKSLLPHNWNEAVHYCTNSYWDIFEMNTFIAMTGQLPPDSAKFQDPREIIELYREAQNHGFLENGE